MSLIDKLVLIRGWTWRIVEERQTIAADQVVTLYSPPTPSKEIGWVVALDFSGNDDHLGIRIVAPGYETGWATFRAQMEIGIVLPPPSGSVLVKYYRPNPLRTIGFYLLGAITSAFPWPFFGPVRIQMSLRTGTTEAQATGGIVMLQIIVEDRNLFLKDLRKVLYGRWAPLMNLIGHVPLLRKFVAGFERMGIPFKEEEKIEPPGVAR